MCLYPRLMLNKKYTPTKKNGGKPPPLLDERLKYVPIACQKCMECLKTKAREWNTRLQEDIKEHKNAKFITLTFNDKSIDELSNLTTAEGYERDNAIATIAMRRFLERYRKKHKVSLRHWLVTELGHNGTENLHMHGIVYTDNIDEIEKIWQYGYVWTGKKEKGKTINYVSQRTINYITKYVTKTDPKHSLYKPKILTSKGIGAHYIKNNKDSEKNKYRGKDTE